MTVKDVFQALTSNRSQGDGPVVTGFSTVSLLEHRGDKRGPPVGGVFSLVY